jgi:TM2 domain-containing membrane protein YozV
MAANSNFCTACGANITQGGGQIVAQQPQYQYQQQPRYSKKESWIMSQGGRFRPEHLAMVRERLDSMPEDIDMFLYSMKLHDPVLILVISILVGEFGVDRFVLGDIGLGVGKLLTLGGLYVWWAIDLFFVMGRAKDKNFEKFMAATNPGGQYPQY